MTSEVIAEMNPLRVMDKITTADGVSTTAVTFRTESASQASRVCDRSFATMSQWLSYPRKALATDAKKERSSSTGDPAGLGRAERTTITKCSTGLM